MDKNENLISITEVPAGPYIIKGCLLYTSDAADEL